MPVMIHASRASRPPTPSDSSRRCGPRRRHVPRTRHRRHRGFEPFEPVQQRQRFLAAAGALSRREQLTSGRPVAARQGIGAGLQQLFRFALPLRERAAGALDVGARLPVRTIEKQHAGPDVDRQIVPAREVVVEAGQQQLFDSGVAITIGEIRTSGADRSGAGRSCGYVGSRQVGKFREL